MICCVCSLPDLLVKTPSLMATTPLFDSLSTELSTVSVDRDMAPGLSTSGFFWAMDNFYV